MITTRIILDTRRALADGTFPVKLQVIANGRTRTYTVLFEGDKVTMTKSDYDRARSRRPKAEYLTWAQRFAAYEIKARKIIAELDPFTFAQFKAQWSGKLGDRENVFWWYARRLEKHSDKPGTVEVYQYSMGSLKKFCRCTSLPVFDVTPEWLTRYTRWMRKAQRSDTTISIHLRCLRAVINDVRDAGIIRNEHYPFGSRRFQIPSGNSRKRALTVDQLLTLYAYDGEEQYARDMFTLSYLLAGMNMADLFRIRVEHITGDELRMQRTKTGQDIVLTIQPEAKAIMDKYRRPAVAGYIFGIVTDQMTATQSRNAVKAETRRINDALHRIAAETGLPPGLTTYWARHTFATVAKSLGLPVAWIKEALSHSDVSVTENYLSGFEADRRRELTEKIAVWK